jgi:hypothetical protein
LETILIDTFILTTIMKFFTLIMGIASIANAHTLFTTLRINDKNQGDGTCVRQPSDAATATGPIYPLDGDEMACGRDGGRAVPFICPAPNGAKLTFEFRGWPDYEQREVIDEGHKGPCAVYIKKVDDMFSDSAAGGGWMKIWEDGYDVDNDRWCVDTLIENNGLLSVNLPTGLPDGYYIVRPEVIALHFAYKGDPQYYANCAQIYIEGGGSGPLEIPSEYEASIPGYVSGEESGLTYNIYESSPAKYTVPGPKVYRPSGGEVSSSSSKSQEEGVIPEDCLVKNANWCGLPITPYSGESDCWAGSKECWKQSSACYDNMPPSGAANCKIWSDYCESINDACNSGDFEGPPSFKGEEVYASDYDTIPEPWGKSVGESEGESQDEGNGGGEGGKPVPELGNVDAETPPPTKTPVGNEGEGQDEDQGQEEGQDEGQGQSQDQYEDDGKDDKKEAEPALSISEDGRCGGETGQTCKGSAYGDCCSRKGRCGRKTRHCTCGCQSLFGACRE